MLTNQSYLWMLGYLILVTCGPANAGSTCADKTYSQFLTNGCNMGPKGLTGLFKQKVQVDDSTQFAGENVQGSEVEQGVGIPVRAVRNTIATTRLQMSPERRSYRNALVYQSINESISEFGTKQPAELHVRCSHGRLEVLLNFPGFPMSSGGQMVDISYVVDDRDAWAVNFSPAQDFFAVGLWETAAARSFLSTIVDGSSLNIAAMDIEKTPISADFDISGLASEIRSFASSCIA